MSAQMIHFHIKVVSSNKEFYCTFVYVYNDAKQRESLWKDMVEIALKINKPGQFWVI